MTYFLLSRFASLLFSMTAIAAIAFFSLEALPGDAAQTLLGPDVAPEAIAALAHKLGLDRPPLERFASFFVQLIQGDLGVSAAYDTPAAGLILDRLAVSLPLALLAMALTLGLAIGLGLFAAAKHGRAADAGVMAVAQLGMAVPNFWLAILLILLFAAHLRWFPAGGFPGWENGLWAGLQALILPACSLALVQAAILARVTRSSVLDVSRQDFVRTARAKGLSEGRILRRHVLRNALSPILTLAGLQFANLLASAIVIETVFSLPGVARLIFQSISNRDNVVVRDCIILLAAAVVAINFLTDILAAMADPRLRTRVL